MACYHGVQMDCTPCLWSKRHIARHNYGLNKGEAGHMLARAVFFHERGEVRDGSFESQAFRASGLNLVVSCHHLVEHHRQHLYGRREDRRGHARTRQRQSRRQRQDSFRLDERRARIRRQGQRHHRQHHNRLRRLGRDRLRKGQSMKRATKRSTRPGTSRSKPREARRSPRSR